MLLFEVAGILASVAMPRGVAGNVSRPVPFSLQTLLVITSAVGL